MSFIAGAILIGAAVSVAGAATTAAIAGSQAKKAGDQAKAYGDQLARLEANRQALTPEAIGLQDLSSQITNPYANLQVATRAAEMQATQTDISLANTLDLLRSTGAGAGGATALAREAAASKQGIAASIEAQEAANARLRAQGEQQRQQAVMAEQQRVQQGMFTLAGMRENREQTQLERTAALQQGQQYLQTQYRQQMLGAISGTTSDISQLAIGYGTGLA